MILFNALFPPQPIPTTLILAPGVIGGSVISCIVMINFQIENKSLKLCV
jgi:hypothetical protein